jgi:hypothetical protein
VLRVRRQDAIEKPSRFGRIAFALPIQSGDRKIELKIESIRAGRRRSSERVERFVKSTGPSGRRSGY